MRNNLTNSQPEQSVGVLRVFVFVLVKVEVQIGHMSRYLPGGHL